MKKLSFLALFGMVVLAAGCNPKPADPAMTPPPTSEPSSTETKTDETTPAITGKGGTSELRDKQPVDGEEVAVLDTKYGRIVLRFYQDKAPGHVKNFKDLAKKAFYDGTTFHRIIPGFMIQGGDPNSKDKDKSNDGGGGPGYQINAEFNEIAHQRGTLSMARSEDVNSAGSQFFICVGDSFFLDTKYTAFGRVVFDGTEKPNATEPAGLAVADKIVAQPKGANDNPNERIEMKVKIMTWPLK